MSSWPKEIQGKGHLMAIDGLLSRKTDVRLAIWSQCVGALVSIRIGDWRKLLLHLGLWRGEPGRSRRHTAAFAHVGDQSVTQDSWRGRFDVNLELGDDFIVTDTDWHGGCGPEGALDRHRSCLWQAEWRVCLGGLTRLAVVITVRGWACG